MNKYAFLVSILLIQHAVVSSQQSTLVKWWNPADTKTIHPEGQGWPGESTNFFARLSERASKTVRRDIYDLAQHNAGIILNFQTNAPVIKIQYVLKGYLQLPHMQATGVSGVDLYCQNKKTGWLKAGAQYSFADTVNYTFSNLHTGTEEKVYKLYLPLYNTINWIRIGVDSNFTFTPANPPADKPIVVFGTSIAQGACASRPGMAWPAILGRTLNIPIINLGFSGNGKLEPEVIDLIGDLDARLYIFDCMPNLASTAPNELKKKIILGVKQLRQKHPFIPILLTDHPGFGDEEINKKNNDLYISVNETMNEAVRELQKEGIKKIYLLTKKELGLNDDCFIDQIHPNDAGMLKYAQAYYKKINTIFSIKQ